MSCQHIADGHDTYKFLEGILHAFQEQRPHEAQCLSRSFQHMEAEKRAPIFNRLNHTSIYNNDYTYYILHTTQNVKHPNWQKHNQKKKRKKNKKKRLWKMIMVHYPY